MGTIGRVERRARVLLLGLLAQAALLSGCGEQDNFAAAGTAPADELAPLHVDGAAFRDAGGRQVLLRGYNARVQGIFDVTFDDGRVPLESIPPFDDSDAQRFEALGLDVLRLPVNWSGLEPHPLQYSETYMQRIDAVVALGRRHHFYVLIDMHQDAYSKEIGEDGAPLWAIVPAPKMLLQGPLTDLNQRRVSSAVIAAFGSFFQNKKAADGRALQDAFVAALQQLVKRYVGNPAVVGYEAFNEPVVSGSQQLDAFYGRLAAGVHAIDPDKPVFFEPSAFRNSTDQVPPSSTPWPNGPGVYAPHIYTTVFSPPDDSWASQDPAVLAPSMEHAALEAQAWGTPLFVGEFGIDQTLSRGPLWLSAELDLQDRFLASSTVWVWRETGYWGLLDANGTPRPATVQAVTRPYPRAVAGDLLSIERPAPDDLVVHYRGTPGTAGLPNEVAVSPARLADYEVRCDGEPVAVTRLTGRARFTCPASDTAEHVFEVGAAPTALPGRRGAQ